MIVYYHPGSPSLTAYLEQDIPCQQTSEPFFFDTENNELTLRSKRKGNTYTPVGAIDKVTWNEGAFLVNYQQEKVNPSGNKYWVFASMMPKYWSITINNSTDMDVSNFVNSVASECRPFKVEEIAQDVDLATPTTGDSKYRVAMAKGFNMVDYKGQQWQESTTPFSIDQDNQNQFIVAIYKMNYVSNAALVGDSSAAFDYPLTGATFEGNRNGSAFNVTISCREGLGRTVGTWAVKTASSVSPCIPFEIVKKRSLTSSDEDEIDVPFNPTPESINWITDTDAVNYTRDYDGIDVSISSYVKAEEFVEASYLYEEGSGVSNKFSISKLTNNISKALKAFWIRSIMEESRVYSTNLSILSTQAPFIVFSGDDAESLTIGVYKSLLPEVNCCIPTAFEYNKNLFIDSAAEVTSQDFNIASQFKYFNTDEQGIITNVVTVTRGDPIAQTLNGLLFQGQYINSCLYWGRGKDTIVIPKDVVLLPPQFLVFAAGDIRIAFPEGVLKGMGFIDNDTALDSTHLKEIQVKNFQEWNGRGCSFFSGDETISYSLLDAIGNKISFITVGEEGLRASCLRGCNSIREINVYSAAKGHVANTALTLAADTEKVTINYEGSNFIDDFEDAYKSLVAAVGADKVVVNNNALGGLTQPNFTKIFNISVVNDTEADEVKYFRYTISNEVEGKYIVLYKSSLIYSKTLEISYDYFFPNEKYKIEVVAHTQNGYELTKEIVVTGIAEADEIIQIEVPPIAEGCDYAVFKEDSTIDPAHALFPSIALFPSASLYPISPSIIDWGSYDKVIVLREDLSTGRSVIVYDGEVTKYTKDYSILSGKTYQYFYYCLKKSQEGGIILNRYKSQELKVDFSHWLLMEVDKAEGQNYYTLRQAFSFDLNVSIGNINNGNSPSIGTGIGRCPTIQMDASNYWQGSLTSLLGILSDEITYSQTIDMEETLRGLSNSPRRKFLKDNDGCIWEVEVSGAPSIEAKESVWVNGKYLTLKNKQVTWVQTGNADYISIID